MRILHAYNRHRGGGGADNATVATIELQRRNDVVVEVFSRDSGELPTNICGRLRAGASAVYATDSVSAFSALLEAFKPDLVHVHEVFPLVSPWILPECRRRGVPVVKSCVDYRLSCPVGTHLRQGRSCFDCAERGEHAALLHNCRGNLAESATFALYNAMTRRLGLFRDNVDRFVAPSRFARDLLVAHAGLDPARVVAVAPAVAIPAGSTDPGTGTYVAYAGRITPEKGIGTLLGAARIAGLPVRLARSAASLVVGDLPSDAQVVVTHSREELAAFYRGARFLVMPSDWFESFGLVGAEAMSHGVPLVASRIGALTELVDEGVDGLLFEPGHADELARKMRMLWDDPARCRQMGEAARRKAAALWSADRHHERIMAVYASLFAERHDAIRTGA